VPRLECVCRFCNYHYFYSIVSFKDEMTPRLRNLKLTHELKSRVGPEGSRYVQKPSQYWRVFLIVMVAVHIGRTTEWVLLYVCVLYVYIRSAVAKKRKQMCLCIFGIWFAFLRGTASDLWLETSQVFVYLHQSISITVTLIHYLFGFRWVTLITCCRGWL